MVSGNKRIGPDYIQFYPTVRCNRSCDFCFNKTIPSVPDMSMSAYREMLSMLKHHNVRTIDIMGGEPTLHPDIIEMVRTAVYNDFSVNLSSNGSSLPVISEIMRISANVTVGISVNDRQTYDATRAFIYENKPVVKSVYSPRIDTSLISDILALGPKQYYILYRDALQPHEHRDTVSFPRFLSEVRKTDDASRIGTVFCSGFIPQTSDLCPVRCPAGTSKLGIMPDGSVYPCNLFFGMQDFMLGNILIDRFESLWDHQLLTFFRTDTGNSCQERSCLLHAQCRGGCPAHSLAHTGSLNSPDPRCARH